MAEHIMVRAIVTFSSTCGPAAGSGERLDKRDIADVALKFSSMNAAVFFSAI